MILITSSMVLTEAKAMRMEWSCMFTGLATHGFTIIPDQTSLSNREGKGNGKRYTEAGKISLRDMEKVTYNERKNYK